MWRCTHRHFQLEYCDKFSFRANGFAYMVITQLHLLEKKSVRFCVQFFYSFWSGLYCRHNDNQVDNQSTVLMFLFILERFPEVSLKNKISYWENWFFSGNRNIMTFLLHARTLFRNFRGNSEAYSFRYTNNCVPWERSIFCILPLREFFSNAISNKTLLPSAQLMWPISLQGDNHCQIVGNKSGWQKLTMRAQHLLRNAGGGVLNV